MRLEFVVLKKEPMSFCVVFVTLLLLLQLPNVRLVSSPIFAVVLDAFERSLLRFSTSWPL